MRIYNKKSIEEGDGEGGRRRGRKRKLLVKSFLLSRYHEGNCCYRTAFKDIDVLLRWKEKERGGGEEGEREGGIEGEKKSGRLSMCVLVH